MNVFRAKRSTAQSRVAQRKRAGPITQRSMDRNHPLLSVKSKDIFLISALPCHNVNISPSGLMDRQVQIPFKEMQSRVAQRKRAGPITQRSMDRNHPLLSMWVRNCFLLSTRRDHNVKLQSCHHTNLITLADSELKSLCMYFSVLYFYAFCAVNSQKTMALLWEIGLTQNGTV